MSTVKRGLVGRINRHFRPNRVEAYAAALAAVISGLVPVLADLDASSTAGILACGLGCVAVVVARVPGWAQYEKFIYTVEMAARHEAAEEEAAAKLAAFRKSNPKAAASGLALPR